ncbi:MAG: DUF2065 domain-containing protein [Shimia sp.]
MTTILTAIALVMIVEGLVYALAPSLVEDLLEAMRQLSIGQRRMIGLGTLAAGTLILAIL